MITSPVPAIKALDDDMESTLQEFESFLVDGTEATSSASSDISLEISIPTWSPSSFNDLSSCFSLREKTLSTLYHIRSSLSSQGIHSSYKLYATPSNFASIRPASPPKSASSLPSTTSSPTLKARRNSVEDDLDPGSGIKIVEKLSQSKPFILPLKCGSNALIITQ